jgi:MFS family permease
MSDFNPPLPPYPPAPLAPPFGYVFPMTFGQILDRIFRVVRSNLRPFLAIGVVPFGVLFGFYAVFFGALYLAGVFQHPPAQPNIPAMLWIIVPLGLLFIPAMFVMYGLYYGASTYAAVQADRDVKVTAGEAFRHAWSKLGRYVWLMVLRSLIISIPIAVLAIAIGVGGLLLGLIPKGGNPNPAALFFLIPLAILFYLGAIAYAVLMSLRLSLAFPACVRENLTAMQAIKRSGVLTNGAKGRIFLVILIIYAISYAIVMVLYAVGLFVFAIGALATAGHASFTSPITIILAVVGVLVLLALFLLWSAILMAAYSTAFAVFYRDQSLRQQGPPPMPVQVVGPA